MREFGVAVAFGLAIVTMLWYRQANSRFSKRVLGYDTAQRPGDARRVLTAWRVPSTDPETERWRTLMHRRLRLFLVIGASFFVLPALFGLVGLDWEILSRNGAPPYLPFAALVALLAVWSYRLTRILVAYGFGEPLDRRGAGLALLGLLVAAGVAVAIVVIAGQ